MSDVIGEMVNRFLSWPLPDDVCVDAVACQQGAPHRAGTNLLTAAQARQMIEHVCAAALAAKDAEIESYRQWQEQALINCARRDCATRDKRLADLEARAEKAEAEAARLQAAIEQAPHDKHCVYFEISPANDCDCWKRAALAQEGEG